MENYSCFQGQFTYCCCIKAGCVPLEKECPSLCLCIESHLCNGAAVSATRMLIMDRYDVSTDKCDNQLIRCSNCLQLLRCVCDTMAIFYPEARDLANIIDIIADLTYHTVSGCMTAQVAHEINYQLEHASNAAANANGNANQSPFNGAGPGVYGSQEPAVAVAYEAPYHSNTDANSMMTDNKKW